MHLPVPARPHDLCQSPGIVAVPSCSALSSSVHWPDGLRCRSPAARHASALRIATPLESKLPNRCAPAADPVLCKVATSGSGSLAARSSFMMRPVSSTTQIAVSSSDTPTQQSISWLPLPNACGGPTTDHAYHPDGAATAQSFAKTPITPSDSKVPAPIIISNDRFRNGQRPLSPRLP
jgi:hypothetical protein